MIRRWWPQVGLASLLWGGYLALFAGFKDPASDLTLWLYALAFVHVAWTTVVFVRNRIKS